LAIALRLVKQPASGRVGFAGLSVFASDNPHRQETVLSAIRMDCSKERPPDAGRGSGQGSPISQRWPPDDLDPVRDCWRRDKLTFVQRLNPQASIDG
jgi:hypothetical protein